MPDKTWKQFERRIAKRIGGRRLGPTGTDTADVVSDWLVVECKHRKTLPAWVQTALDKARRQAGRDRLGLAVLHEKGTRDVDSLVVLSLGDFLAWFDPVPAGPDPDPTGRPRRGLSGKVDHIDSEGPEPSGDAVLARQGRG